MGWGRRADGSQGAENSPTKGAAETRCLQLFDANHTERQRGKSRQQLCVLLVCVSPSWVNMLLLNDCTSPRQTQRTFSCSACFAVCSSLKHRSPAGGQNTLLTLATALNSVYESKSLRERKHYTHLQCSPAPAPPLLTPARGPVLRWHKSSPHLVKAIELKQLV